MANIEQVEDLKHSFTTKAGLGDKLPHPSDVADKSSYYLKSSTPNGDTFVKHKMISGRWMKEVVRAEDSAVVLEPVG